MFRTRTYVCWFSKPKDMDNYVLLKELLCILSGQPFTLNPDSHGTDCRPRLLNTSDWRENWESRRGRTAEFRPLADGNIIYKCSVICHRVCFLWLNWNEIWKIFAYDFCMFPLQSLFILGCPFITWHNLLQLVISASKIPQEGCKEDVVSCGRTVKDEEQGVSLLPFFLPA